MATIAIFVTQYFSSAAGLDLAPTGELTRDGTLLFKADVRGGRISNASHYEILGIVARETPDRAAVSVRYAKSLDIDKFGTLGLASKAAVNLRGALHRHQRYHALISSTARPSLEPRDGAVFVRMSFDAGHGPGAVFAPEAGLCAMLALYRQISTETIVPVEVNFAHAPPRDVAVFEEFFGCPVRFHAPLNGLLFSDAMLDMPNRLGDAALSAFLTTHLDQELQKLGDSPSLIRSTKEEIARVLSEGPPSMKTVAQCLGFSARSFHRRLSDHGVSFQTLAEETRRDIALGMLRNETHSLSEVAFLTGFSEQSSFNRAFKRWTGQTPARYRKERVSAL